MLKIKFNRKFKKIIALSTLAAVTCSSNLIQSMKEDQDPVDIILSLTQDDREKLLELMRKHKTADGQTDFEAFKHPVYFKPAHDKEETVLDGDYIDTENLDEKQLLEGWVAAVVSLEYKNNEKEIKFGLLKNNSEKHIYLTSAFNESAGRSAMNLIKHYKKLKGTKYDPKEYEWKFFKTPKAFSAFCEKLAKEDVVISKNFDKFSRKLGMSPRVGAGVIAASVLAAAALGTVYAINER